jgi:hypothetical protein
MLGLMALWLGGRGFGVERDEQAAEKAEYKLVTRLQIILKKKKKVI